MDLTQDAGHGRRESRTLKLAAGGNAVTGGILFPHAQLAVQIVRRRRPATSRHWHSETLYGVTDLSWHHLELHHLAQHRLPAAGRRSVVQFVRTGGMPMPATTGGSPDGNR